MVESRFSILQRDVKLWEKFNHNKGVSLRKVAKSLNYSKFTIQNMLKMRTKPILCYKITKIPGRTPLQRMVARRICRHLNLNYREHQFVIDDESYYTMPICLEMLLLIIIMWQLVMSSVSIKKNIKLNYWFGLQFHLLGYLIFTLSRVRWRLINKTI